MAVTEAKIGTTLHVDQCLRCNHVWFDVGELEKIPVKGDLESHFPRAQLRSDQLGQDAVYNSKPKPSNRDMLEVDVHSFGLIGALGLPAEQDHVGVKVFPAGTVALVMACFGATARALHSSEFMAKYSYVAQEPFANHGYSFFISALIHADYKHFLGNMYFLSIFGDNIEDQDGPWVLFTIFWLSVAAGHLLTSYFDVPTPSIGASGGISGLLSYYALMFPHNRMRLTFFRFMPTSFLNVNISIGFWFIQWLLFQMVGATGMYFHSHSEVNFYAHVGGALAGVLFYLYRSDQLPAD